MNLLRELVQKVKSRKFVASVIVGGYLVLRGVANDNSSWAALGAGLVALWVLCETFLDVRGTEDLEEED